MWDTWEAEAPGPVSLLIVRKKKSLKESRQSASNKVQGYFKCKNAQNGVWH